MMATAEYDIDDLKQRMAGAITSFKSDLSGLRTGRASSHLLDPIMVEAYGQSMPLNQVSTVNVPEPRMIVVQVWDKAMVAGVEKAIRESNIGISPVVDGTNLRLPMPELNEERRKELVKVAHQYAETSKVATRHVRRDGMENLKKLEKDKNAVRYEHLSHLEVLEKKLEVMDAAAVSLARDNNIPVVIFSIAEKGGLAKILNGEGRSTTISE